MVLPDWKTAPAMPAVLGSLICTALSPSPTSDQSSLVFSLLRKSVERSALSMRVASLMTRRSRTESSSELVMSDTRSRNSISCCRVRFMRSMYCVFCSAAAACRAMASSSSRSLSVKRPPRLLRVWTTPITSALAVRIGTQRMERVLKPVFSSTSRLKRASA